MKFENNKNATFTYYSMSTGIFKHLTVHVVHETNKNKFGNN